jgi:hypothetical protein
MANRRCGLIVLVLAAGLACGCARAQAAKTTPDGPPLDMPAPPPRDVEPTSTEVPPPVPLPQEPARTTLPPPRQRPAPTREPARQEPPKPEPPPPEPPKPAPPPPAEEPKQPSTLQTKPAGEEGDVERTIRATLTRATTDLNRVDYRTLNTEARAQYDFAKAYIRQAEDAIRQKNLVFAKTNADKAAVLAAQLAGR